MINNDKIKKAHLANKDRYPRSYKEVEKILKIVKNCEANAKTVLHNAKISPRILNKVYALTFSVLKQNRLLNAVIEEVHLLEKEPFLRKELAEILLHEMIFGKGLPPGESKPVQIVRKYEAEIQKAYNHLLEKGISISSGIHSIPKYVRINTLVATIPEVLEDLEYLGVEQVIYDDSISESEYLEVVKNLKRSTFLIDKHFKNLLVFHSDENLTNWSLYQKGHVLIQDKSSYIPPYVLNPEPGSVVLDACAAPGMKTLHLASLMENKGTLYAFERDEKRFKILKNMLQSSDTDIFQTFCGDFNSVDVNDEKFSSVEYILLDPSCSGSGMVNRMDSVTDTEESKNDVRIQKLAGFQIILLKHALLFPSVKRVVYSTCSITEQENEYVVHEALNHFRHKFKLTHVLPDWPIRGSDEYEFGPLCLRAYADKSLTNGFFVAMFERIDSFDGDNKFPPGKRARKDKKKKFLKEENIFSENPSNKTQKYERHSQNDRDSYGDNQHEKSFNHFEENIDSNNKDNEISYNKPKQHLAQESEIENSVIKDNKKHRNKKRKLETNDEKNTTEEVSELPCKKRKKKHHDKDFSANCDGFIQNDENNLNSDIKNNYGLKKTKCKYETNDEKNVSPESVVELICKKRKKKHHGKEDIPENCDEFTQNDEKNRIAHAEGKLHCKKKHDKKDIPENCDEFIQNDETNDEKNSLSHAEEKLHCKNRKKKHHDKEDIPENCDEFIQNDEKSSISHAEEKLHCKKRKKKHHDNEDIPENCDEFIQNDEKSSISHAEEKLHCKKRKKKHRDKEDIPENCDEFIQNDEKSSISHAEEKLHCKKHKKKHDKKDAQANFDEFIQKDESRDLKNPTNNCEQDEPEAFKQHKKSKHSKKHKRDKKDSDSIEQINLSLVINFSNNNEEIVECKSDSLSHKHRKKCKKNKI